MSANGDDLKGFKLLAHRGYAARFPENTRTAIKAAVDAGARFVEFDIQLSRDQVPHLLHDDNFQRTGNSKDQIFALDAAQIAELRVGEPDRFGSAFADMHVPLLAEIVEDLSSWPDVTAFVEIKRQSIEQFGVESVLDAVLPVLEVVQQQCVIISFDAELVEVARSRIASPIGWAIRTWNESSQKIAETLQPEFLFCNVSKLPAKTLPLWKGGWTWVIYEITSPAEARELVARGVGIIETMAFAEMYTALRTDT